MFGLEVIDIVVLAVYFAVVLFIGFRSMKRIHNQEDYFLGGRRFGKVLQIFTAFGQATSSETAVSAVTTTYNNGASGVWSVLLYLWSTPVFWFTSPWYRRMRVLTLGDYFEERFGSKRIAGFFSIIASLFLMTMIGFGMKAVSKTVLGVTQKQESEFTQEELIEYNQAVELEKLRVLRGENKLDLTQEKRLEKLEIKKPRREFSYVDENVLIWSICVVVFVYALAGGLQAAVYTDMLQGIFIILLSIILVPFGLSKVNSIFGSTGFWGAMHTIHQQLPEWYFDIFGSAKTVDFTWYYIFALSALGMINVAVQANQMNAIASAKDELTARIGFTSGCFMKRFCTVLWGFTGLITIVLYSGTVKNPDYVWGHATRDLLGGLGIGLVGLMIACLLAALMSTADTLMITTSGVLTHNLYRPLLPNFEEKHYVRVGRVSGGVVLVGAALMAARFDTILQMLKFIYEFNAILAAAFWCGIKWRRTNRTGAWSSMIVAMLIFAVIPIILPAMVPKLRTNSYLLKRTDPEALTRTYTAHQMDVAQRNKEIEQWDELNKEGQAIGPRPIQILVGQEVVKVIQPPRKSVFWQKGIKETGGVPKGQGLFYIEMVVVDRIFDLSKNPHALNETVRTLIRIVLPFSVLIIVSLLTKPDDKQQLDRFYVKMRTPVILDREKDRVELEKSYANPDRFRGTLLFPNSNFEFFKWKKIDTIGFVLSVLTVFGIIGIFYLVLNIGA